MAWNPSPEVAVARDAAHSLRADQVVILYLRRDEGFDARQRRFPAARRRISGGAQ